MFRKDIEFFYFNEETETTAFQNLCTQDSIKNHRINDYTILVNGETKGILQKAKSIYREITK